MSNVFALGDSVVAIAPNGRILREMQVARIGRTYFETSDGAKWRADGFDDAKRIPEGPDAPRLRHRRKSDAIANAALDARDAIERYKTPATGQNRRDVIRAAKLLGVMK